MSNNSEQPTVRTRVSNLLEKPIARVAAVLTTITTIVGTTWYVTNFVQIEPLKVKNQELEEKNKKQEDQLKAIGLRNPEEASVSNSYVTPENWLYENETKTILDGQVFIEVSNISGSLKSALFFIKAANESETKTIKVSGPGQYKFNIKGSTYVLNILQFSEDKNSTSSDKKDGIKMSIVKLK